MKKTHIFLNTLISSSLPFDKFYSKLKKKSLIFSLKYFVLLVFISLTLIITINCIKLSRQYNAQAWKQNLISSMEEYPPSLKIFIQDNKMITTYDRPYIFSTVYDGISRPLIVVDQYARYEQIKEYNSRFLLTHHGIAISQNENFLAFPFSFDKSVTIDQQTIKQIKELVIQFFNILPLVSLLFYLAAILVVPLGVFLLKIFYLLILSSAAFLLISSAGKKIAFAKVLQTSLHASTIPLLLEFIVIGLGIKLTLPVFSYMSHVIPQSPLLLFLILNLVFILSALYYSYFSKRS